MYKIYCDNYLLHDSTLDDYQLIEPICNLGLNSVGSLTFKILPTHRNYDKIKKLKSEISFYQDDIWIFTGRVLDDDGDFGNVKSVTVEGELSYLLDSNQREAEYHNISVSDYLSALISKHNEMVDDYKKFNIGNVTVVDSNDELYRYSNFENTYNTIQEKLVKKLGGYLKSRHTNGLKYIDYLKTSGNLNTQIIKFSENLLDLKNHISGDEIATAIIPRGAKKDDDTRIDVKSVNNGIDFIYDENAVNTYGWIWKVIEFDDVTLPSNLLTKAYAELEKTKNAIQTIELNSIDLHLIDVNVEKINVGDKIRVISQPHSIDTFMTVSKIAIDITKPQNTKITLGATIKSFTENANDTEKIIENVTKNYATNEEVKSKTAQLSSLIEQTAEEITSTVEANYTTKTEFGLLNEYTKTEISQLADEITFNTTTINSNQELLEEYVRFNGANIEIAKSDSISKLNLTNDEIQFNQNGQKVAYLNNGKFYIPNAEITAKSGNIGGFNINNDYLSIFRDGCGLYLGAVNHGDYIDKKQAFYAGGINDNGDYHYTMIDYDGYFFANSGNIGGWAITSDKLVKHYSADREIIIGGDYVFHSRSNGWNKLTYLNKDGFFYAMDANILGKFTATRSNGLSSVMIRENISTFDKLKTIYGDAFYYDVNYGQSIDYVVNNNIQGTIMFCSPPNEPYNANILMWSAGFTLIMNSATARSNVVNLSLNENEAPAVYLNNEEKLAMTNDGISVNGTTTSNDIELNSIREIKNNISELKDAISVIKKMKIYNYELNAEKGHKRVGFVIDDDSREDLKEILSADKNKISLYNAVGYLWKINQQFIEIFEKISKPLEKNGINLEV